MIEDKDDPRRLAIVQYQREAVDVLYAWAAQSQVREAPSTKLVPSEPIVEPTRPAADASLADWHEYVHRFGGRLIAPEEQKVEGNYLLGQHLT